MQGITLFLIFFFHFDNTIDELNTPYLELYYMQLTKVVTGINQLEIGHSTGILNNIMFLTTSFVEA